MKRYRLQIANLRSQMSQERLNAVAIMNIHKEEVMRLSIDELVDTFISRNAVRKTTFWVPK